MSSPSSKNEVDAHAAMEEVREEFAPDNDTRGVFVNVNGFQVAIWTPQVQHTDDEETLLRWRVDVSVTPKPDIFTTSANNVAALASFVDTLRTRWGIVDGLLLRDWVKPVKPTSVYANDHLVQVSGPTGQDDLIYHFHAKRGHWSFAIGPETEGFVEHPVWEEVGSCSMTEAWALGLIESGLARFRAGQEPQDRHALTPAVEKP